MKTFLLLLLALPQMLSAQIISVLYEGDAVTLEVLRPGKEKAAAQTPNGELAVRLTKKVVYPTQFIDASEPFLYVRLYDGNDSLLSAGRFRGSWSVDTLCVPCHSYEDHFTVNLPRTVVEEMATVAHTVMELRDRCLYLSDDARIILNEGLMQQTVSRVQPR